MGSVAVQKVYGINAPEVCEEVNRMLLGLHDEWSPCIKGNSVDLIHSSSGQETVQVSEHTIRVLSFAKEIGECSGGAFDITAGPLTDLWRTALENKTPPDQKSIAQACKLINYSDLTILEDNHVKLARKGQKIDLGGIGKGYAADLAREIYIRSGIRHAVLSIGGNVLALNCRPDGSPWKVGIRNPFQPEEKPIGYVEVCDCSVVTSGDYEQFFEYTDAPATRRYHHIIDPRTGWPSHSPVNAATIISRSSMLADALATTMVITGREHGMDLCRQYAETEWLAVEKQKNSFSPGLKDRFVPLG